MNTVTRQEKLKAAEAALRKAADRYQGDPINREALLQARATYRALWSAAQVSP